MPYKTIKEVTQLTGTTAKALRYYDDKGLLSPSVKRTEGRREWLYDTAAIRRLKLIMLYRQVGFGVDEIAQLLQEDEGQRTSILLSKVSQLTSERRELDHKISAAGMLLVAERIGLDKDEFAKMVECLEELKNEE